MDGKLFKTDSTNNKKKNNQIGAKNDAFLNKVTLCARLVCRTRTAGQPPGEANDDDRDDDEDWLVC